MSFDTIDKTVANIKKIYNKRSLKLEIIKKYISSYNVIRINITWLFGVPDTFSEIVRV